MSIKYFSVLLLILVFCFSNPGKAQSTFIGISGNNFSTAANWNPAGVPASGLAIIISAGKTMVVDMNYSCTTLTIKKGASFGCSGGNTITITNGIIDETGKMRVVVGSALVIGSGIQIPVPGQPSGTFNIATNASEFDATIDDSGNLYCAYVSSGNVYIKKNLETTAELVSPGSNPAIAVDLNGNIHIIYTNSGLQYKKKTGAVWGAQRAVPGGTVFYSIDTDASGAAHVASDDGGNGGRGHIVYIKDNSGTWSAPIWEPWGWYDSDCRCGNYFHLPVIRIDNADNYHLAFAFDNWGGKPDWSSSSINIMSNSIYGDKGVGVGWLSYGLNRNSLTLNGAVAYLDYNEGGTQNVALVNSAWTVQSSFAGGSGSANNNGGTVGVAYVSGNVKYIENTGSGFSTATDLGAGSSPIALIGSGGTRYVYYLNGTTIKLAYNFDL